MSRGFQIPSNKVSKLFHTFGVMHSHVVATYIRLGCKPLPQKSRLRQAQPVIKTRKARSQFSVAFVLSVVNQLQFSIRNFQFYHLPCLCRDVVYVWRVAIYSFMHGIRIANFLGGRGIESINRIAIGAFGFL